MEKKSLVEETILQMKNLEDVVTENAKGILESTMRQEIKELVKESLKEQEDEEIDDTEMDMDMEEPEMDLDMDMEDDEMDMDIEDDEMDMDMEEPDMEIDTIDLTQEPTSEVLRVFKLMSPEDEIVVTKDSTGNINLKDNETDKEYMIVGEGMDEFDEMNHLDEMDEFDMEEEETIYEMEMEDEDEFEMEDDDMEMEDEDDDMEMEDEDDEILYEIEMEDEKEIEDAFEEVFEEDEEGFDFEEGKFMMESKKSMKPKGMGMGKPKFEYGKTTDYPTKKQKQGDKLPKGLGKKVKYEFDEESPSLKGEFKTAKKETKEGMKKMPKKMETKEASRTLGNGKYWGKKGLPKPKAAPRHLRTESVDNPELQILREKNEEYRKALNIFRTKLDEVAIFNSNLAYATRLFTEHSTSKQEKINILKRFDSVETLKESKNLYKTIKDELTSSKPQQVNESVERTITKSPSTGSAVNLIESKTYENPQFLRMKDLMSKLK